MRESYFNFSSTATSLQQAHFLLSPRWPLQRGLTVIDQYVCTLLDNILLLMNCFYKFSVYGIYSHLFIYLLGSINSCCSGIAPVLIPWKDSWTCEFTIVNFHQSDCCLLKSCSWDYWWKSKWWGDNKQHMFGVWWAFCNDTQIEFWIYVTEMISYSRVRPSPPRKEQGWARESGGNQAYLDIISEVEKYRQKTLIVGWVISYSTTINKQ